MHSLQLFHRPTHSPNERKKRQEQFIKKKKCGGVFVVLVVLSYHPAGTAALSGDASLVSGRELRVQKRHLTSVSSVRSVIRRHALKAFAVLQCCSATRRRLAGRTRE